MFLKHLKSPLIAVTLAVFLSLGLSGCWHHASKVSSVSDTSQAQDQFDMVVHAYKKDQFMLDGAVLSADDFSSHLAYLQDNGKLPHTLLLEGDSKGKIRKSQIEAIAHIAYQYRIASYMQKSGKISQIEARPEEK